MTEKRSETALPLNSFFEALERAHRMIREAELEIVMHPDDVTDALRSEIEATPLTTLRESTMIERGKAYLMRPGAMEVLRG